MGEYQDADKRCVAIDSTCSLVRTVSSRWRKIQHPLLQSRDGVIAAKGQSATGKTVLAVPSHSGWHSLQTKTIGRAMVLEVIHEVGSDSIPSLSP